MATVKIDIKQLGAAHTALTTLSNSIDSARHSATRGTPIGLDDLADSSSLARAVKWLRDQETPIQKLKDLATLLDVDHKGQVSYQGTGTSEETNTLLVAQLTKGLQGIGDIDSPEDRARATELAKIFQQYAKDPSIAGPTIKALGPSGTTSVLYQLQALMYNDAPRYAFVGTGLERTQEVEDIKKLQDTLAASLAIAVGTASTSGQLPDDFGKQLVENSGDGWAVGTLFHYGDLNNVDFGTKLLVSAGDELLDRELHGGVSGWQTWQVNQHLPRRFGMDGSDDTLVDDPTLQWLKVLDNNVAASQQIMLDSGKADYLLGVRSPPYEDPPGDAAGDVLRVATVDQALDPGDRGKNAAEISSHIIDHFGVGAEALAGVNEEIGGIIATYIGDVERVGQVQNSHEQPGTYANGADLPDWLKNRGLPTYGIHIDRNDLIDILKDVGGNDVAASAIGDAATRLNQVRLQDGIDHVVNDGQLDNLEVGEDDSFSAAVKNSAMLNGFLTDAMLHGDIKDAKETAEERKKMAEFFTLPLDMIPTDHTGPIGDYVVGNVKDAIVEGYVGDGVPDAIAQANTKFGSVAASTQMQALYTLAKSGQTSPDGSVPHTMPVGDLANDWPKDDYGNLKPPSSLTGSQIDQIIYNSTQGGHGYATSTTHGVSDAVRDLIEIYGDGS